MPCFLQISAPLAALFCTEFVASCRTQYSAALCIVSDTLTASISTISSFKSPLIPFFNPLYFNAVALIAFRTTARIAAFMPGASPPLVNTPMVLISLAMLVPPCELLGVFRHSKLFSELISMIFHTLYDFYILISKSYSQCLQAAPHPPGYSYW